MLGKVEGTQYIRYLKIQVSGFPRNPKKTEGKTMKGFEGRKKSFRDGLSACESGNEQGDVRGRRGEDMVGEGRMGYTVTSGPGMQCEVPRYLSGTLGPGPDNSAS